MPFNIIPYSRSSGMCLEEEKKKDFVFFFKSRKRVLFRKIIEIFSIYGISHNIINLRTDKCSLYVE